MGPNGSGKSNVVDALSWVMGEQGAKSLRGGKMEDVIFAGTSSRSPLGRAEVVLTIDNTDGALPIEYTEVSISRTMFRSGGSEYAINGSPARLLDVQELLSDSGIGREMHVIVGQGQLDTILQATPEIRRGLIEEAAGILKHRKRKEKAVRKLEATRLNLERLHDLILEIRRQLKPLGKQAEVARKAATIQADLRDAKSRILADDLVQATTALEADLADEAAMKEARAKAELEAKEANDAEVAAEGRLQESGAKLSAAQEMWYALSGLRERVVTTISISAERMRYSDISPQLNFGNRDPETLEADAREVREQEAELLAEAEKANENLTDVTLSCSQIEAKHTAAETAYAEAQRAIADRREGLARLNGQVNSLKSRLGASAEEIGRLERRRADALSRAEQADNEFKTHEATLSGLNDSESDLDASYEEAVAKVSVLKEQHSQLKTAEAQAKQEQAALTARVDALRLGLERKDASEAILASGRKGIFGRLSDKLSVTKGWEPALSAALGMAAEALVVDSKQNALNILNELKTSDDGRTQFVLADAVEATKDWPALKNHRYLIELVKLPTEYKAALTQLLGGVVAVDDLNQAAQVLAEYPTLSAVTADGMFFTPALAVGGSSAKPTLIEVQAAMEQAENELATALQTAKKFHDEL
ncbi:MAG: chromosome segregation protein SMC, partial [Propionibacterium sp.]